MNTNTDFDRHASDWLADGPTELADRVLDAALREVHLTRQRRRWSASWRNAQMSLRLILAAGVTVAAIAVIAALGVLGGGPANPSPTPASPTPPPSQSTASLPASQGVALDLASWPTYTSAQYGFTIGHPKGWAERPATRAWSFATDNDAGAPHSDGADHFTSPDMTVRMSAWSVPLESSANLGSWPALETWIGAWCTQTGHAACSEIHQRAVPMCNEARDCHPALLIAFDDDVLAFATGGNVTGVLVVAVWRGDPAPQTAAYGGSRALLEAALSTVGVVPATIPGEIGDAAATFIATGK